MSAFTKKSDKKKYYLTNKTSFGIISMMFCTELEKTLWDFACITTSFLSVFAEDNSIIS